MFYNNTMLLSSYIVCVLRINTIVYLLLFQLAESKHYFSLRNFLSFSND